jgi:hypothetical protein
MLVEGAAGGVTRYGSGGPQDHPPQEEAAKGFLNKYFLSHHLLRSGVSILVFDQPLP